MRRYYKIFITLFLAFSAAGALAQTNTYIDSLAHLLGEVKGDTQKVNRLLELSELYYRYGTPDKSIQYAGEALELSRQLNYEAGISGSLNLYGINSIDKGDYTKALEALNRSLEVCEATDLYVQKAYVLGNIGTIYSQQQDGVSAEAAFLKALESWKKSGVGEEGKINTLDAIATIYAGQRDYEKALKYGIEALNIKRTHGSKAEIASTLQALVPLLMAQKQREKALKYSAEAKAIWSVLEDSVTQSMADKTDVWRQQSLQLQMQLTQNAGRVYEVKRQYGKALTWYQKLLSFQKQSGNKTALRGTFYTISKLYIKQKKYTRALLYLNKGLQNLQEQEKRSKQEILLYHSLAEHYNPENSKKCLEYGTEAMKRSEQSGHIRELLMSLNLMSIIYKRTGATEKSLDVLDRSLKLCEMHGIRTHKATVLSNMGVIYEMQGKYKEAETLFLELLNIYDALGSEWGRAFVFNAIGVIHMTQGNYEKALEYYLKALQAKEAINDRVGMAIQLNNMSQLLLELGQNKKSLEYATRALAIYKETEDPTLMAAALNIEGIIYMSQDNYKAAAESFRKALQLTKQTGDKRGMTYALRNIGRLHERQEKHDEALDVYLELIPLQEQLGDRRALANTLYDVSILYAARKNNKAAQHYAEKSLQMAREIHALSNIRIASNTLAKLYARTHNYKEAYEYLGDYIVANNSLFNEEKNKQIAEMQTRFETEKKEKENALLKKEGERQVAELKQKRTQRNALMAVLTLVFILSAVWIRSYRQKLRSREQLMTKNEEINRQKSLQMLKDHELQSIKSYIEGQESERQRIAQDFHDGVGGALAAIKLNLMQMEVQNENKQILQKALSNLNKTYEEVRTISHHLTPLGMFPAAFIELLEKFVEDLSASSGLNIIFQYESEKELNDLDEQVQADLYRIVQELLNNVLKHADATRVDITLRKEEGTLTLKVKDNGLGFDSRKKRKGIGLSNIQSRVKALNGQLEVHSEEGAGTQIEVRISEWKAIIKKTTTDEALQNTHSHRTGR